MSDGRDPSSERFQDTQVLAWTHSQTRFLLLVVSPPAAAAAVCCSSYYCHYHHHQDYYDKCWTNHHLLGAVTTTGLLKETEKDFFKNWKDNCSFYYSAVVQIFEAVVVLMDFSVAVVRQCIPFYMDKSTEPFKTIKIMNLNHEGQFYKHVFWYKAF